MIVLKTFKSFSSRIALLVAGLLTLTLVSTFILVNRENSNNARQNVEGNLTTTEDIFTSLLNSRTASLFDVVRPATRDHAFRTTFIDGHVPTLESAMQNLLSRIRYVPADLMILTDLDLNPIAQVSPNSTLIQNLPLKWLTERAFESEDYESSGIVATSGAPYQLITSPLLIPDPRGWVLMGFPIEDQFVQSTKTITRTDVSIAIYDGSWRISSTTLTPAQQRSFVDLLPSMTSGDHISLETELDGVPFLTRLKRLDLNLDVPVYVGLHGNLNQALAPYERLNRALYLIFGGGLFLSAFGALALARSVSSPVKALTGAVQSIRSGNLTHRVDIHSSDELGQLGGAFNEMAAGLEEKERVRNLLGKVVSEEIASELLANKIELGGEEKEVTVLFCDVRNFTQLCETRPPPEVVAGLNDFFSEVAKVVDSQKGVVDKYMGDAVMALFGAPVPHGDEECRAVTAALELRANIQKLATQQSRLIGPRDFGIGIASGIAIVGNMGSENRLNYSVIGDSINVGARLESLTKFYQIPILVNEATALKAPGFKYRWIDRIHAKGKNIAIDIFEPLAADSPFAEEALLDLHHRATRAYIQGEWSAATALVENLMQQFPDQKIYKIYRERIEQNRNLELNSWDGVFTHSTK